MDDLKVDNFRLPPHSDFQVTNIRKLKGLLDLVVLKSLKAVEMYSDKCFSMSATLIQALPYEEQERIK